MNTHSLEKELSRSTNSILVGFFAVAGTVLLFSLMSLSRVGEIAPLKEPVSERLEVFLPPPPPPPPPKLVEATLPSQSPIRVEIALKPRPTQLQVKTVEVEMEAPSRLSERIHVNLSEFQHENIEVDLQSIVYDNSELDELPSRSYTPLPSLPPRVREKLGNGHLIVQLSIDEKGKPMHVFVLSTPVEEAKPYIIKTLKRWRFRPAIKGGEKVKSWVRFELQFNEADREYKPFSL